MAAFRSEGRHQQRGILSLLQSGFTGLSRLAAPARGHRDVEVEVAARIGAPDTYVDYAGSKAAVDAMALGLSKELGREGVRVNSIRPGVVETEIHAAYGEPERPYKIGALTPLGRPGTANEIAEAIVWLLSDASSYVTGAIIDVTGGR